MGLLDKLKDKVAGAIPARHEIEDPFDNDDYIPDPRKRGKLVASAEPPDEDMPEKAGYTYGTDSADTPAEAGEESESSYVSEEDAYLMLETDEAGAETEDEGSFALYGGPAGPAGASVGAPTEYAEGGEEGMSFAQAVAKRAGVLFGAEKSRHEPRIEPKTEPEFSDEHKLLIIDPMDALFTKLEETLEDGTRQGSKFVLKGHGISVSPDFEEFEEEGNVRIRFTVSSKKWGWDIVDVCRAKGSDLVSAFDAAVADFTAGLGKLLPTLKFKSDFDTTADFGGKPHKWSVWSGGVSVIGEATPPNDDFFAGVIIDELVKRLGSQRFSVAKILIVKTAGRPVCEVRLNEERVPAAEALLASGIDRKEGASGYRLKQYIFLQQEKSTSREYTHTESEIRGYVVGAAKLFYAYGKRGGIFPRTEYREDLKVKIGDPLLADEIAGFLPELCAEHAFPQISYGEQIVVNAGEDRYRVYKSQLASYNYIKRAVDAELGKSIKNEVYKVLVKSSATYSVILEAGRSGVDLINKRGQIAQNFNFSEGYEPI
ncbi:MAG: DUF6348 family protein [Clostridiales Family XIII bacterium]|nr:DUF6348 family protein [Clostridiales Family XIII bacterium]